MAFFEDEPAAQAVEEMKVNEMAPGRVAWKYAGK